MDKMLRLAEAKEIDEAKRTITAYVSTDAIDRMNESIDPNGVDLTKYKKNPVVLWAHDYSTPPIAKALWIKRDGGGLISKMEFAKSDFAQEIFDLYKGGFMKAFSVGFIPKEMEEGDGIKKPRWTYKKSELLEYSAVPVPANPEALALAVKAGILKSPEIKKSFEEKKVTEEIENLIDDEDIYTLSDGTTLDDSEFIQLKADFDILCQEKSDLITKVESLEAEIVKWKYENYQLKTLIQQKLSEKAVDNLSDKFLEMVSGAIRKAQGKVN